VGIFHFDAGTATIDYQLTGQGLSDVTAAHIHRGAPGQNGEVVAALLVTAAPVDVADGVLANGVLDEADLVGAFAGQPIERLAYELLIGDTYANVHTTLNPQGEIRGQIVRWTGGDGSITFAADLSGLAGVPPVNTTAGGTAVFRWNPDGGMSYQLVVHDITGVVAAHIHLGAAGQTGPVSVPLFSPSAQTPPVTNGMLAESTFGPDDVSQTTYLALIYRLATGGVYVNVHTEAHPDGEIRGQVFDTRGEMFLVEMSGAQEVPAVDSDAMGWALFSASPDTETMHYQIIVSNLYFATAAHLHLAGPNEVGVVIVTLFVVDEDELPTINGVLAEGVIDEDSLEGPLAGSSLSDLLAAILAGEVYVNVHTEAHPGGEIRGQLS
jgi:hypothetical protein